MTQEERRQRRKQDTKNAIIVLFGLICIVVALVIGVVLVVGHFVQKDEVPVNTERTEIATETERETEKAVIETEAPKPVVDEATMQAIAVVSEMTLEQKVAQMFVITPDDLANVKGATVFGNTSKQAYSKYPVGGLIYTSNNLKGKAQTADMVNKTKNYAKEVTGLPVFIGVEEEGGSVTKIASAAGYNVTKVNKMSTIGASGDANKAYEAGAVIGKYLYNLGFNFNLAPVADILGNEENTAMKDRVFGSDPTVVTSMVLSVLQGFEENNVYGVIKHFPGQGNTAGDSSSKVEESSKTLEELRESDLIPFKNLIHAGVDFIMVGHISVPNVTGSMTPSSMSDYMISQILRKEMGFDGIIITDAMDMKAITDYCDAGEAAVTCILSGADICLMPKDLETAYNAVLEAVQNGVISEKRLNESVTRILELKIKRGVILSDTDLIAKEENQTETVALPTERADEE